MSLNYLNIIPSCCIFYIWTYDCLLLTLKKKAKIIPPQYSFHLLRSSFYQLFPFLSCIFNIFPFIFFMDQFQFKVSSSVHSFRQIKTQGGSWLLTAPWFPSPSNPNLQNTDLVANSIPWIFLTFYCHSYSHSPDSQFHHYSLLDSSSAPHWVCGPEEQHGSWSQAVFRNPTIYFAMIVTFGTLTSLNLILLSYKMEMIMLVLNCSCGD